MKELSAADLGLFAEQQGMLLKGGIGVAEGLALMQEGLEEGKYKVALAQLEEMLKQEAFVGEAFAKVEAFPSYFTSMVKVGFETGRLDEVMERLALYYTKEAQMLDNVKRILFYPLILLGIMGTVILVITTQVVPIFEDVLRSLGMEMSGIAVGMMNIGTGVAKISSSILLTVGVGGGIASFLIGMKGKKRIKNIFLQKSQIYEKMMITRFTKAVVMMLASGMDATYAVEVANDLVEHEKLSIRLQNGLKKMQQSHGSFLKLCEDLQLFSHVNQKRLTIGARAGCIDEVLIKLTQEYEEELTLEIEGLLDKIEPLMITILACVVGSLLVSVMFPLISIMSTVG